MFYFFSCGRKEDKKKNMFSAVLALHSVIRWLVVGSLLLAMVRGYYGWRFSKPFTLHDNSLRHWTATIAHIQLLFGVCLYFISPVVDYFLHHFKEAIHEREIRFFGMEHSLMMFLAIVIITIGSLLAKRRPADKEKFKTMAIWFTAGLILILTSVPWKFSPFISRPYFRPF